MALSELLKSLKDKKTNTDSSTMKLSKQLVGMNKNSAQTFNKLLKIQEKTPTQTNRQIKLQTELNKRVTLNNEKMDLMTKTIRMQYLLMQESLKIQKDSNSYLQAINDGLGLDRRERRMAEDEARRDRRLNVTKPRQGINLNKTPEKGGLGGLLGTLGSLLPLLTGGGGILSTLASVFLGSKVVKGLKSIVGGLKGMFGFVGGITTAIRSFLFGSKIVENVNGVITQVARTEGIFAKMAKVGKSIASFLGKTGSMIYDVVKNISIFTKISDAIKATSLGQKAVSIAQSATNVGKAIATKAKPVTDVVTKVGGKAIGLGGKMLSGISNMLAPTVTAGAKTGGLLGRVGGAVGAVGKMGGGLLGKALPGVGAFFSASTAISDFQKGDYLGTLINGLAAITNFMGPVGMLVSGILSVVDLVRKGEITGIFNTVSEGIKSVVNFVTDTFNPMNFIDGIKKWWGSTWLGKQLMSGTTPSVGGQPSGSQGGFFSNLMSGLGFGGGTKGSPTGAGGYTGGGATPPTGDFWSRAFAGIQKSEGAKSTKITRDNVGFAVGKYQLNSAKNRGAWLQMGFTPEEVDRVNSGDIGFAQARLDANPQILEQANARQEAVLKSGLDKVVKMFTSKGADVSNPVVQAQLMDIRNQFGAGGMDSETVQKMMKFSGGKKITPQGVLAWRMQTAQNAKYGDQSRRWRTVQDQFVGYKGTGTTPTPTSTPSMPSMPAPAPAPYSPPAPSRSSPTPKATSTPSGAMPVAKPRVSSEGTDADLSKKGQKKTEQPQVNQGAVGKLPVQGVITSYFGRRIPPTKGASSDHLGIDIGAGTGTPIYSPYAGTVLYTYPHWGAGNVTEINHGRGLITKYLHQSKILVSRGQSVSAGQEIGKVGNTGSWTTGPHLHFVTEINGKKVNPLSVLKGGLPSGVGAGNVPEDMSQTETTDKSMFSGMVGAVKSTFQAKPFSGFEGTELGMKSTGAIPTTDVSVKTKEMESAKAKLNKDLSKSIYGSITPEVLPPPEKVLAEAKSNKNAQTKATEKATDKTSKNLKKGVKETKATKEKTVSKIRQSMVTAIKSGYPSATVDQINLVLDKLKIMIPVKTDEELLAFLDRFDSVMIQTMLEGFGLDSLLKASKVTPKPITMPMTSPTVTSETAKPVIPSPDKLLSTATQATEQGKTVSGVFKSVGAGILTAFGVPNADKLMDLAPNPVSMIENIASVGSALFSGDSSKIQSALENQQFSGLEKNITGLIQGKASLNDVMGSVNTLASGFGLAPVDTANLGNQAVSAISGATGFDVGGVLKNIGIDPNAVVGDVMSGKNPLTSSLSSLPALPNIQSLDLMQQGAIQQNAVQGQIQSTLSNIQSATQGTSSGVSQMASGNTGSKSKANLLSYADIGTAQIQSNVWG